jgi:hypothetical protein
MHTTVSFLLFGHDVHACFQLDPLFLSYYLEIMCMRASNWIQNAQVLKGPHSRPGVWDSSLERIERHIPADRQRNPEY